MGSELTQGQTEAAAGNMRPSSPRETTCALVVAFHPDMDFRNRVERIAKQVGRTFVLDNTPGGASLDPVRAIEHVEVIVMPTNVGVGHALNRGFARAREQGFEWAVTLDQDSTACDQMVTLLHRAVRDSEDPDRIALVGPRILDQGVPGQEPSYLTQRRALPWMFARRQVRSGSTIEATMVITSGALTRVPVHEFLGGFREDFFIDYIDTEYCLRARRRGYRIVVSGDAVLLHNMGEKRRSRRLMLVALPTFHAPFRLYYIHRNRIPMYRMYALAYPHWFFFDILAAAYNLFRVVMFENDRGRKIRAAVQGTLDGIKGRSGPAWGWHTR